MDLPPALTQALRQGRLLVVWGALPFPLAARPPANRALALNRLPDPPPGSEPAAGLSGLPSLPILSLDASSRVERAFQAAGVPLQIVRSRRDAPAGNRHTLLKLAGDLPSRSGVILSRTEIDNLPADADKRYLLAEAGRVAVGGALLLVDCDPAGEDFRAWWTMLAPAFRGTACFVVGEPPAGWPDKVACLGPDLDAVSAALWAAQPSPAPEPRSEPLQPTTITWLHLSDLHCSPKSSYDETIVVKALLRDVAERIQQDSLRPDFITVTGDIALTGKPNEYEMARAFFDDLLGATGLDRERLFLVPGNHDVDRSLVSVLARTAGDSLSDRASVNNVLVTPGDRRSMLARFRGYARFTKSYLGKPLAFDSDRYFYVRTLDLAGQRIALLGLNSAWLCASDEDKAKGLAIGERQVREALEAAQDQGASLTIALLHHPFDWLREFDQSDSATMLLDQCDFVLHGHLHQLAMTQLVSPDSGAMVIAGGACYKTREFPNMVNWVRLDLNAGTGTVYLRRYSDARGGFWTKDVMTYRNVTDGFYRFDLPKRLTAGGLPGRAMPLPGGRLTEAAAPGQAATATSSVHGSQTIAPGGLPASKTMPPGTGGSPDHLAAARDLLLAAFAVHDLRRLFLYTHNVELQPVTHEFSTHDGLAAVVDKAIDYCRTRDLLPDLLREVKSANPRQYARFADRLEK